MTKSEIEKDLQGKGNFVQIDHLNRFLKEHHLSIDTRKFIFLKLASLYEGSKLFGEAAKMYENAAGMSLTFAEKIKHYMVETDMYVKLGAFDRIDQAVKKALSEANSKEREDIQVSLKQMFKAQAAALESEMKRNHAVKFYERILDMKLSDQERRESKEKLLDLYKKTGKLHEALVLEKSLG